ncbi:MAG TPA: hypothetical protein VGS79_00285 [Puia sp.]|nr:hypothetical protein [Puia sp.]
MKKKKVYRDRLLKVLLTEKEYEAFEAGFKKTTFRIISDYHRALLFGKPVKLHYRNRSLDDFLDIAGQLKVSLDAIDRNWARAVLDLRERSPTAEITGAIESLLSLAPTVLQTLENIRSTLLKFYQHESQNRHVPGDELPGQL